ncbi:DNA alkylation repair protein [Candidatus Uhrbacteria bacterium]|nr:DNA alkylation repair protein [Candidatus Uhrbacteria bacterium]
MHKFLLEVERELKKLEDKVYKTSNDRFNIPRSVGISSEKLKTRIKNGFSFSKLPDVEQWKIWNFIIRNSRMHEAQMSALRFAEDRIETIGKQEWNYLRGWADFVDNWAHSDVLSKVYSFLLEKNSDLILPTLKKWNKSKNPWKERTSIVSLIYYASPKRKAPSVQLVLEMVEPLITIKDKYVQKGVGWTLRECHKLYPKETLNFIWTNVRNLSADSFFYATEKFLKTEKTRLLEKRRIKE